MNWAQKTIKMIIAIASPTPIINGIQSLLDHARDIADTLEVNSNLQNLTNQVKINLSEISKKKNR